MLHALNNTLKRSGIMLVLAGLFMASCNTNTPDPQPGTGTTQPGSGTSTTPGSGTTTNPGSGTSTTPGSGTTVTVVASVTFIAQKSNLNLLEAAIVRAGLVDEFNKSNITIFAPSDDAFKAVGLGDVSTINNTPVAQIQRVLRYHVVADRIDRSAIPAGVSTVYQTTLADNRITVFKTSNSDISVNNGKIIEGDNPTVGSVVHIINTVLRPSTGNLVSIAKANTNLTLFAAAVDRANASTQSALNAVTQNGLTVFAPNDAAFKAAGYADVAAIQKADQTTISDLLRYHVLNTAIYSQNFQNGADIVTAQGTSIRTNVSNGTVTLLGKGNGTSVANIVTADQVASNGVLHVIDRVLLAK